MRLILREDVEHLGAAGEIVSVRAGYGRNFLLPRGLAAPATESDVARIEHEKKAIASRQAKRLAELKAAVEKLEQVSVSIARAVGEGDKLYGSVTNRDIADALRDKGVSVDAKAIALDEPLKALGEFDVDVKLGKDAVAKVKVWVVKKA